MTIVMNFFLRVSFLLGIISPLLADISQNDDAIIIKHNSITNSEHNCNNNPFDANNPAGVTQCADYPAKRAESENMRIRGTDNGGDLAIKQFISDTEERINAEDDGLDYAQSEFGDNTKCQCKPLELQTPDDRMVCTCISYAQDINPNEVVPACGCKPKRLESGECACDIITCDNIAAIPYLKYDEEIAASPQVKNTVNDDTVNIREIEGKHDKNGSKLISAILQQDFKPDPKELKCNCEATLVGSGSNTQCECKPFVEGGNLGSLSPPCGCKINTSILANGSSTCGCIPFSCSDVSEKRRESKEKKTVFSCESRKDDTSAIVPEANTLANKLLCGCQTNNEDPVVSPTAKPLCSCQYNDLSSFEPESRSKPLCSCQSLENIGLVNGGISSNVGSNVNEEAAVNLIQSDTGNKPPCNCQSFRNNDLENDEISFDPDVNVDKISETFELIANVVGNKLKPLCNCGPNNNVPDSSLAAKPLCNCDYFGDENPETNSNNPAVGFVNKPLCSCQSNDNVGSNLGSSEDSVRTKPLCSCKSNDGTDVNTEALKPPCGCGGKTQEIYQTESELFDSNSAKEGGSSHNNEFSGGAEQYDTPHPYQHNVEGYLEDIDINIPVYANNQCENIYNDDDENYLHSSSYEDYLRHEPHDGHIRRSKIKINDNAFDHISKALSKFASFSKKFAKLTPKQRSANRRAKQYDQTYEFHISTDGNEEDQRKYFKYDKDLSSSHQTKRYKHKKPRKSHRHDKHKRKRKSEDRQIVAYDRDGNYKVYELF